MHPSDWAMSYHVGEVINDVDPTFSGRVQVLATGLYPAPIWVEPLYAPGVFAVPAVLDKVALFQVGPSTYRWGFVVREKADVLPAALLLEYPMRRALMSKPPAPGMEPAMMGFDAAGIAYVGHFNATEPMVLGQKLLTQLATLCTTLQSLADNTKVALESIGGALTGLGAPEIPPTANLEAIQAASAGFGAVSAQLSTALSVVARVAATPTT